MRFGPWLLLERAVELAPRHPGVFQTRGEALLPLPRGKSAMVLYAASGAGEPLDVYLRGDGAGSLRQAAALGARWIRFGESAQPDLELARLLANFEERFGATPPGNTSSGDPLAADETPDPLDVTDN